MNFFGYVVLKMFRLITSLTVIGWHDYFYLMTWQHDENKNSAMAMQMPCKIVQRTHTTKKTTHKRLRSTLPRCYTSGTTHSWEQTTTQRFVFANDESFECFEWNSKNIIFEKYLTIEVKVLFRFPNPQRELTNG